MVALHNTEIFCFSPMSAFFLF